MVEPKIAKKINRPMDKTIFRLLSHLMPLPTPDSADKVEQIMTTPKATNKDAVEGTPSVINHCAPVMLYKPDENDAKPKPMV